MSTFSRFNNLFKKITLPEVAVNENIAERLGETITPNMRALRLSMTVADYLLSMNIPASNVADISLTITDRYCERKVSIEIIATLLMFSQDRGNDREPLTLIRSMTPRRVNSSLMQSIQDVTDDIHAGKLPLGEAEKRLEKVLTTPKKYPQWVLSAGSASISAGVGALLSGSPLIIAL
jgi:uncharacterized membrane protein YjjP (DUF1212 family)